MDIDSDILTRTRRSLHAVAEHLLAGPQYRTSGTIRLRPCPGGFATRLEPALQVVGTDLVTPAGPLPLSGTDCATLAAAAGLVPGGTAELYSDGSGVPADQRLEVDPAAARRIADAFALGDAALRALFPGADPVLWPEHFDLGVTAEAVNYGVSPGDTYLAEPYAYVGPHIPRTGAFWNAPFGAARPMADLPDEPALLAFFTEGRHLAALGGSSKP
ncbi:hypothetical protein GCM10010441_54200 [Kitasatospora paracochleata]|uniref:Uncharacterized protein n=1 Tax=Kitasatospora paracochleata TaxID=58354 RepID=A0ABT1IV45_9ACTN|nr:hypothetical protein [Kitasatospora paracochleata]MCP2309010.1 hypothetical protein [Kitasatospora paracochleata]